MRRLLLRGAVVQNAIGATFLPVVLTLAARGPAWWTAVHEVWPYQQLLEPSTSTFACLCVDAGLLSTLFYIVKEGSVLVRQCR